MSESIGALRAALKELISEVLLEMGPAPTTQEAPPKRGYRAFPDSKRGSLTDVAKHLSPGRYTFSEIATRAGYAKASGAVGKASINAATPGNELYNALSKVNCYVIRRPKSARSKVLTAYLVKEA